jgi:hypothetical protein
MLSLLKQGNRWQRGGGGGVINMDYGFLRSNA